MGQNDTTTTTTSTTEVPTSTTTTTEVPTSTTTTTEVAHEATAPAPADGNSTLQDKPVSETGDEAKAEGLRNGAKDAKRTNLNG